MAKNAKFAIPTLIAAGLAPFAAAGDEPGQGSVVNDDSLIDSFKKIVANIDESHEFTLARHSSHASHASHQSHRSYSYRVTPEDDAVMQASAKSRNESSTPYNSVLPSTPAIAKKLKVLPGNSEKFHTLVTRMQLALIVRGYEAGEINGEVHARTVAALYRYQSDAGFVPSGKVTPATLSSLGLIAQ
jgi:His-Xaa-Ser repeat protein HxsA